MDFQNIARAYSLALSEFEIRIENLGEIKESDPQSLQASAKKIHGKIHIRPLNATEVNSRSWSCSPVIYPSLIGATVLGFISKKFPNSAAASAFQSGKGLVKLSYKPEIEPEQNGFGYAVHVALRKLCDTPPTTLLYRLLAEVSGTPCFGAFSLSVEKSLKDLFFDEQASAYSKIQTVAELTTLFKQNTNEAMDNFSSVAAQVHRYASRVSDETKEMAKKLDIDLKRLSRMEPEELEGLQRKAGNIAIAVQMLSLHDIECMFGYLLQSAQDESALV